MTYEERIMQSLQTKLGIDAHRGAVDLLANSFQPNTFPHEFFPSVFYTALSEAIREEIVDKEDLIALVKVLQSIIQDMEEDINQLL